MSLPNVLFVFKTENHANCGSSQFGDGLAELFKKGCCFDFFRAFWPVMSDQYEPLRPVCGY